MASGAILTRLDLPTTAFTQPTWWSSAMYKKGPSGWVFQGYTKPAWQTFSEHVGSLMGQKGNFEQVSWVWFEPARQWVRA